MLILETLALNKTSRRPVWIMRQAGRYLASFRKLREKYSFTELCHTTDLATEVSLLPMRQYSLDAAIIFSDILFPLQAMGADLSFSDREGPVLKAPATVSELRKLKTSFSPEAGTPQILTTLSAVRKEVAEEKAVFGFAGAPFTMLSYLLEGKLTKDLKIMKRWMAKEPAVVHEWLGHLARAMGEYLDAQARAGADAVQLFDTWAGILSPEDYEKFALPYARTALSAVTVPSIYYVNGVAGILDQAASVGAQGLSIDWRLTMGEARRRVSSVVALQGNLDPYHLFCPASELREKVFSICKSYGTGPGHIFNLGHGIVPEVPEDAVKVLIDSVHEWSVASL